MICYPRASSRTGDATNHFPTSTMFELALRCGIDLSLATWTLAVRLNGVYGEPRVLVDGQSEKTWGVLAKLFILA